jgi:hypothetical protein
MTVKLSDYAYQPPKADPTELKAGDITDVSDGVAVFVISLGSFFEWNSASTETPDDIHCIVPDSITPPAPGRWEIIEVDFVYNAQTGATYTLTHNDEDGIVSAQGTADQTYTLPSTATESIEEGWSTIVANNSDYILRISPQSLDTINGTAITSITVYPFQQVQIRKQTAGDPNAWEAIYSSKRNNRTIALAGVTYALKYSDFQTVFATTGTATINVLTANLPLIQVGFEFTASCRTGTLALSTDIGSFPVTSLFPGDSFTFLYIGSNTWIVRNSETNKAFGVATMITDATSSRILSAADSGKVINFTANGFVSVVIQQNTLTVGAQVQLILSGSGFASINLTPQTGVTIVGDNRFVKNDLVTLTQKTSNVWEVNVQNVAKQYEYVAGYSDVNTFSANDVVYASSLDGQTVIPGKTQWPTVEKITDITTQAPFGVAIGSVAADEVAMFLQRGVFVFTLATGGVSGDPVFVDATGVLTLTETTVIVGYVVSPLTATTYGVYIDVHHASTAASGLGTAAYKDSTDDAEDKVMALADTPTANDLVIFDVNGSGKNSGIQYTDVQLKSTTKELLAYQLFTPSTNGAQYLPSAVLANGACYPAWIFLAGQTQYVYGQLDLPSDYAALTNTFQIALSWFAQAGTAAQTCQWRVQAFLVGNGESINQSFGSVVNINDTLSGTSIMEDTGYSTDITPGGTAPSSTSKLQFRIYRNSADSLAASALLTSVKLLLPVA